jgi:hypothetical protein
MGYGFFEKYKSAQLALFPEYGGKSLFQRLNTKGVKKFKHPVFAQSRP